GLLNSQNDREAVLTTEDGTEVRTKYDNIFYPSKYFNTKVRVMDTKSRLELCYRTNKVRWSPEIYITSTLREANSCGSSSKGILTFMADVVSDYHDPVPAHITLVAQSITRPSPSPYIQTRAMTSAQSLYSSYEKSTSSDEARSDINYRLG